MSNSMTEDYILRVIVPALSVVDEKQPPLCDACNMPFEPDENGNYQLQALVLKDSLGESIWGLLCESCRKEYFGALSVYTEKEKPRAAQALVAEMQSEPRLEVL